MNWEVIGITSQVASQNRQANITAATSTTTKGVEMFSHWRDMIVNNAELADALVRANANENVSPTERLQLNHLFDDLFILAAANHANTIQSGALHALQGSVDYVMVIANDNPVAVSQWLRIREFANDISPEFVEALDRRMAA